MSNLNLNEFLRYLAAGAIPPVFGILAFEGAFAKAVDADLSAGAWAMFLFATLVGGSASYIVYRAIFYPFLYYFASRIAGRQSTLQEMDIQRWGYLSKEGNITKFLGEWGSQVHFLYVSTILGAGTLMLGRVFDLKKTEIHPYLLYLLIALFVSALVSHVRLHQREAESFKKDETL